MPKVKVADVDASIQQLEVLVEQLAEFESKKKQFKKILVNFLRCAIDNDKEIKKIIKKEDGNFTRKLFNWVSDLCPERVIKMYRVVVSKLTKAKQLQWLTSESEVLRDYAKHHAANFK